MRFENVLEAAIQESRVHPDRVEVLRKPPSSLETFKTDTKEARGPLETNSPCHEYVLYWVTQSARVQDNPCLALSVALAKTLSLPLVVLTTVDLSLLRNASIRQISFIIEGFADFSSSLACNNIDVLFRIDPNYSAVCPSPSIVGSSALREFSRSGPGGVSENFQGFASRARVVLTEKVRI